MRDTGRYCRIAKLLLGKANPVVHRLIDSTPYPGRGHRIVNHSVKILDAIEILLGEGARKEALLHLLLDAGILDFKDFLKF
ncbi:hypothetical protein DRQ16_00170 [bacterium]|nr:MAG: hypothetical protein DRQ18_05470 [bacterium]RKZ24371.1 MAG: hypothetical protein DRQ16_00170 [bacterium]RKZ25563.1 MAG: hypothetical protein DRQ20_04885 [bacterium]